jgi:hypothetical protein
MTVRKAMDQQIHDAPRVHSHSGLITHLPDHWTSSLSVTIVYEERLCLEWQLRGNEGEMTVRKGWILCQ